MDTITLTLPVAQVQIIVNALALKPYSEVADLIAEVIRQAQPQNKPAAVDAADAPAAGGTD